MSHSEQLMPILSMNRQPFLTDEVQTFKALQTIHKVLQEGHQSSIVEGQENREWLASLARSVAGGDGIRGAKQHYQLQQAGF